MMKPGYFLLYRLTNRINWKVWEMFHVNDETRLNSAISVDEPLEGIGHVVNYRFRRHWAYVEAVKHQPVFPYSAFIITFAGLFGLMLSCIIC